MKSKEARKLLVVWGLKQKRDEMPVEIFDRDGNGENCEISVREYGYGTWSTISSQRSKDPKRISIQSAFAFIRRELDWPGPVLVTCPSRESVEEKNISALIGFRTIKKLADNPDYQPSDEEQMALLSIRQQISEGMTELDVTWEDLRQKADAYQAQRQICLVGY